jgi:hypothetical protein
MDWAELAAMAMCSPRSGPDMKCPWTGLYWPWPKLDSPQAGHELGWPCVRWPLSGLCMG